MPCPGLCRVDCRNSAITGQFDAATRHDLESLQESEQRVVGPFVCESGLRRPGKHHGREASAPVQAIAQMYAVQNSSCPQGKLETSFRLSETGTSS